MTDESVCFFARSLLLLPADIILRLSPTVLHQPAIASPCPAGSVYALLGDARVLRLSLT